MPLRLAIVSALIVFCAHTQKDRVREIERKNRKENRVTGISRIVIDKSDYLLSIYDDKGLFARYPVVFGTNPDQDKFKQGDRRTPEGEFSIRYIQKHKKWHLMMMLDYPTPECIRKFERRKKEGEVGLNDSPGSAIGIHGTWPHDDYLIDNYSNWTDGCISLKNNHIEDLKKYVYDGIKVEIQK